MSDSDGDDDGTGQSSDGRGTHAGGGVAPAGRGTHAGGSVCNQAALVLDPSVFATLSRRELRAVAIVQLEFARGVSALATTAYEEVLAVLRKSGRG